MKNTIVIGALVVGLIGLTIVVTNLDRTQHSQKTIALISTLSHQALDEAQQGFIHRLSEIYGDEVVISEYNAEGNVQQATIIAQQVKKNPDVIGIFVIGTLAAQTMAKVEQDKPIVVAAVSDPAMIGQAHLLKNVCGVTDSLDAEHQITTIKKLLPHARTLALLYSPAEANSSSSVEKLAASARLHGLVPELVGVHETNQIPHASHHACKKSDAVLIPLDNQLVAAMPMVIKATKQDACPIITSNEAPVHQGATIAFGVNYYDSGENAADIMKSVLDGKQTPAEIGFINPTEVGLTVNRAVLEEKDIVLSNAESLAIKTMGDGAQP